MGSFETWLEDQSDEMKQLVKEFPLGTTFVIDERTLYLFGYLSVETVIVTPHNPAEDFDIAQRSTHNLSVEYIRKNFNKTVKH